MPAGKLLPEFNILVRKCAQTIRGVLKSEVAKTLPGEMAGDRGVDGEGQGMRPLEQSLDDELREGGREWREAEEKIAKGKEGETFAVKRDEGDKKKRKAGEEWAKVAKEGEKEMEKRGKKRKGK